MPYRIAEVELSRPAIPFALDAHQDGFALVARWKGRIAGFYMTSAPPGSQITEEDLAQLFSKSFARRALAFEIEAGLAGRRSGKRHLQPPSLSIAICTKDRARRLTRLLESLQPVRAASSFAALELLVVDNASADAATRDAVAGFRDVRYVVEPQTGLDFARNTAVREATGDIIAFLDDDVVVDGDWLHGLLDAWRCCPEAGGFTGLVLPYRLDTAAQISFEENGGFRRGFEPRLFHAASAENSLHPVGAGSIGAGCNMAFDRALLLSIGGFDEALDTGMSLPGGGDLDIFYRVLRCGRTIAYEPRYAVYHEHRETIAALRRQYWTWGLGFMAFLTKSRRSDPALKAKQDAIVRWWLFDRLGALATKACRLRFREFAFTAAETWGGIVGLAGEYDRSLRRVRRIREQLR